MPALRERRRADHRRDQLPGTLDRDQGPPHRDAADEVVGAVDGIDDPARLAIACLYAELLAQDPVAREGGQDPLAEPLLNAGVGLGDEGAVVLGGDRQLAGVVAQGDGIGLVHQPERKGAQRSGVAV